MMHDAQRPFRDRRDGKHRKRAVKAGDWWPTFAVAHKTKTGWMLLMGPCTSIVPCLKWRPSPVDAKLGKLAIISLGAETTVTHWWRARWVEEAA